MTLPDHQQSVHRALARLEVVADRPPAEHVEAFEQLHTALGDALAGPSGPE